MARQLPKYITVEQWQQLYAQANRRYPTGRRNRALMATMYFAGLRVSEAIALVPGNIDGKGGYVQVRNGKGGADRDVPLPAPHLTTPLREWWDVRKSVEAMHTSPFLLCTLEGAQLSPRYVHAMVTRYARKAGVMVPKLVTLKGPDGKPVKDGTRTVKVPREVPAWPHCLRHSYAMNLVNAGEEAPAIQQALGHSDLSTTSVYTAGRSDRFQTAILGAIDRAMRSDRSPQDAADLGADLAAAEVA